MGKNTCICYFHGTLFTLKGKNSCKTYSFRIKVGNEQIVYIDFLENILNVKEMKP